MTYQKFLDIVYHTSKEKDYYCWTTARPTTRTEDKLMYLMYCDRMDRINKFKKEVLTEALKKLPDNYFD